MYNLYCRIYQFAYKTAAPFFNWRKPELLDGENSVIKLAPLLKLKGVESVLIITDQGITRIGLLDRLLDGLQAKGISYVIYDKTIPNPTIENVDNAFNLYKEHQCRGIIGFGGGSPIDCAKGVAARVARPDKEISQMKGQLKVRKRTPLLIAVPTTSGTGSEATVASVISNSETHEKYAINDHVLIPDIAVLDPLLTVNLPPHITSTTGMDALTHAVEAYIGRSNTEETLECSREAVKLIFEHLYEAFSNGSNLEARKNMQKASYLAGVAFTRAYVGYVHAIAHTLGGFYSVPHGLANAIILPYVLEYYGEAVHRPLAELADLVELTEAEDTDPCKAKKFIEAIKKLNIDMKIPKKIGGIKNHDLPLMVERAFNEANPLYPVPRILDKKELFELYEMIKE